MCIDVLFPIGIGAAVGTGSAGLAAGILGAVFGVPLFEQFSAHILAIIEHSLIYKLHKIPLGSTS